MTEWDADEYARRSGLQEAMAAEVLARLDFEGSERVLDEDTRRSSRWAGYFRGFQDPYLHLAPEQYRAAAERNGLRVRRQHTGAKAWDFQSRSAFVAFGAGVLPLTFPRQTAYRAGCCPSSPASCSEGCPS
jgi:hypothetical protein